MHETDVALSALQELLYTAIDLENRSRTYGTDVRISSSEIYLLKIIAENPGCHVTAAAEKVGVTKSAVSQMARRMARKDLVKEEPSPENKSKYSLSLTRKGQIAHAEHMRIETLGRSRIAEIFQEYEPEYLAAINDIFRRTTAALKSV